MYTYDSWNDELLTIANKYLKTISEGQGQSDTTLEKILQALVSTATPGVKTSDPPQHTTADSLVSTVEAGGTLYIETESDLLARALYETSDLSSPTGIPDYSQPHLANILDQLKIANNYLSRLAAAFTDITLPVEINNFGQVTKQTVPVPFSVFMGRALSHPVVTARKSPPDSNTFVVNNVTALSASLAAPSSLPSAGHNPCPRTMLPADLVAPCVQPTTQTDSAGIYTLTYPATQAGIGELFPNFYSPTLSTFGTDTTMSPDNPYSTPTTAVANRVITPGLAAKAYYYRGPGGNYLKCASKAIALSDPTDQPALVTINVVSPKPLSDADYEAIYGGE